MTDFETTTLTLQAVAIATSTLIGLGTNRRGLVRQPPHGGRQPGPRPGTTSAWSRRTAAAMKRT